MDVLGGTAMGRRLLWRSAAAAVAVCGGGMSSIAVDDGPAVVPLFLCGGAYCSGYSIDGQQFRAVLDTGSPFLLVDGTCAADDDNSRWGCYRGAAVPSGLGDTDELYGGEDVSVEWKRGDFAFKQARIDEQLRLTAAVPGAVFGVVRGYEGKGGGGAVFLGLCKQRLPRIRPTLLEQTDIAGLRFDFLGRRLELSRRPLIRPGQDAIRMVDLRPRGAPVANYAARGDRLFVNGQVVDLDRQLVVVVDTGTTGISVDERLFDLLPSRWLDARIELKSERGRRVGLEASVRRRRRPGSPGANVPSTAEEFDEFPLVVSPIRVPWFDPEAHSTACTVPGILYMHPPNRMPSVHSWTRALRMVQV